MGRGEREDVWIVRCSRQEFVLLKNSLVESGDDAVLDRLLDTLDLDGDLERNVLEVGRLGIAELLDDHVLSGYTEGNVVQLLDQRILSRILRRNLRWGGGGGASGWSGRTKKRHRGRPSRRCRSAGVAATGHSQPWRRRR